MQEKIIFITGASSGIGEACARLFASKGYHLLLCARRLEKIQQLADELSTSHNIDVYPFYLDVQKSEEVISAYHSLPTKWQNIHVLINNAGLSLGLNKFQEGNIADWEQMIDTNIKGLLYVTRIVLPGMLQRNLGHIINIGSIAGHQTYPNGNVYCATKHAVRAINESLKMDLLGTAIRVTSIDPGMIETEFSMVRFKGDEERAKSVYAGMQPLTPADIADAAYYCATRPPHVNIQEIVMLPTDQASATQVHRKML